MTGETPTSQPSHPPARQPPAQVQYKGASLDAERGPGLGCFRLQLVVLAVLVVLTPISVRAGWPIGVSAGLLFITIALLLVAGQTIIFLLRLVAADRRSRRRPMAARTKTVGEIEDEIADKSRDEPQSMEPDGGQPNPPSVRE